MVGNVIAGYLWITLGLFFMIFFGGKLFLQLVGVIIGIIFICKGLRRLSIHRAMYSYSMNYFKDQFQK